MPRKRWRAKARAGKVGGVPGDFAEATPVGRGAAAGRRSQPRRRVHDGGGGADPLLNASAKYLAVTYPVLEVAWARYAGHFIYMLLFFLPQRGIRILACSRPALQLLRSTLLCISTVIFVTGLPYVPLATASAISFTGPFIVTALAPLVLGERVGPKRWAAVAIGFVGALVVVQAGHRGHEYGGSPVLRQRLLLGDVPAPDPQARGA